MKIKAVNLIFLVVVLGNFSFASFTQTRPKSKIEKLKPNIVIELKVAGFNEIHNFTLGRKRNKGIGGNGGRVYASDFPSPNDKRPEGVWYYEFTASISKDLNDKVVVKLKLLMDEEIIKDYVTVETNKVTEIEYKQGVKLKLYFDEAKENVSN